MKEMPTYKELEQKVQELEQEALKRIQAEEALRHSEERYRSIFEKSGAASIIIENDMTISMANSEFENLTGYSISEIENKMKWTQFIDEQDLEMMKSFHVARRKKGGHAPEKYECRVINRWGERRDILIKVGMIPGTRKSIASFMDITDLKKAEAALREREEILRKENVRLKTSIKERYRFGDIIGRSDAMQAVYERILKAASSDANVIISGESGTGKELVARAIHKISDRKNASFVVVNCGAIPENLVESEFFGYKKGAFTGADRDKKGYLDLANSGTLFLDELGEIGLNMQVTLLRVIEGAGYMPVGGRELKIPDIRIIAATNRNLKNMVRQGMMREDFFYRVHIIPITIPPLRERKEDLPLLVDHFLSQHKEENHPQLTGKMLEAIQSYHWPGNVRELQNTLHRFATLNAFDLLEPPVSKDENIDPDTISLPENESISFRNAVENYEKALIKRMLEKYKWQKGKTAAALGINRRTLYKKMKLFGFD